METLSLNHDLLWIEKKWHALRPRAQTRRIYSFLLESSHMIDVQSCSTGKQNKSNVGISEGLGREGGDARRGELNLNLRRILTPVDLACSVFASPSKSPSSSSSPQTLLAPPLLHLARHHHHLGIKTLLHTEVALIIKHKTSFSQIPFEIIICNLRCAIQFFVLLW